MIFILFIACTVYSPAGANSGSAIDILFIFSDLMISSIPFLSQSNICLSLANINSLDNKKYESAKRTFFFFTKLRVEIPAGTNISGVAPFDICDAKVCDPPKFNIILTFSSS